jgi:hypothetical protein
MGRRKGIQLTPRQSAAVRVVHCPEENARPKADQAVSPGPTPEISLALPGGCTLVVRRDAPQCATVSLSTEGAQALQIRVTENGIALTLQGTNLVLQTTGKLCIDADELELRGRSGVTIATPGNIALTAAGRIAAHAEEHVVTATLGSIELTANDDVALNGERIRLNT